MADFPSRDRETFYAHWTRVRGNEQALSRTIVADGAVAGNIGSFEQDGQREVGYWLGRGFWGRGIATRALVLLVEEDRTRPLYAYVAKHNAGSIRVVEKCGFVPVREEEYDAGGRLVQGIVFRLDATARSS